MSKWKIGVIAVVSCLVTSWALGQGPNPDQRAAGYRQSLMVLIAGNFGGIAGMAQDRVPYNAQVAATNAERIAFLAGMIPDAFDRDTSGADLETEALPNIWTDKGEFDRLARDAASRAQAALTAVRSGNEMAAKEAIGAIGGACGGCHDDFRVDDE